MEWPAHLPLVGGGGVSVMPLMTKMKRDNLIFN